MLNTLPMAFGRALYPSHAASLVYNYSSLTKQGKRFQYYETEMKTAADGFLTRGGDNRDAGHKKGFQKKSETFLITHNNTETLCLIHSVFPDSLQLG